MSDADQTRPITLDFTNTTLRIVLDSIPMSVAIVGLERTYVFGNKFFCNWYGISPKDIIGMSSRLIFCSDSDWKSLGESAYPIITAGGTYDSEHILRRRDDSAYPARVIGRLLDPALPALGALWMVDDMTDHKIAEANRTLAGAVFLLDRDGRIVSANHEAENLLAAQAGLKLVGRRLSAEDSIDQRRLAVAVTRAHAAAIESEACTGDTFRLRSGKASLVMRVTPLHRPDCKPDGATVTVVVGGFAAAKEVPPELLQAVYALTPAESRLAASLLTGLSLGEAAAAHGTTTGTARKQLAALFDKTGTSRQSELVRLMLWEVGPLLGR